MKPKRSSSLTAIVLALFVVLPTTVSIWVDGGTKKYQERLLTLEILRSDYIQLGTYYEGRVNSFELYEALMTLAPKLGMKPGIVADTISKSSTEEEQFFQQYESGHLTAVEYIQNMGKLARKKKRYYSDRVEEMGKEIERLHSSPPRAFYIKRFLPVLQITGVILVVLINILSLRQSDS